jgi:hypothetical protein
MYGKCKRHQPRSAELRAAHGSGTQTSVHISATCNNTGGVFEIQCPE